MSYFSSRSLFAAAVSVTALCSACGADQKTSNTADDASMQPSTGYATSRAEETAMRGDDTASAPEAEPASRSTSTAPAQSQSQSSEQGRAGNVMAATKPAADSPASPKLSEGQIAMVADLANTSEIEQGKLAQSKAKSESVKKFAAMMVKHHTEAKTEQAKLFKQLSLTPSQSQTATTLKQTLKRPPAPCALRPPRPSTSATSIAKSKRINKCSIRSTTS